MSNQVYIVSDGRDTIAVCTRVGIIPFIKRRTSTITSDVKIKLFIGDEIAHKKVVVRFYASSESSWLYEYPIRVMPVLGRMEGQ